jgi:hypothetical protein
VREGDDEREPAGVPASAFAEPLEPSADDEPSAPDDEPSAPEDEPLSPDEPSEPDDEASAAPPTGVDSVPPSPAAFFSPVLAALCASFFAQPEPLK